MTVDYMQQCPGERNMAIIFKDIVVVQINKSHCALNGKIEFLKTIDDPWKVNIFHSQSGLYYIV
jgi:hypothetical protein